MKMKIEKKHIPIITIFLFGILLYFMGIANHYYFRTVTFDYGNYNFAFADYAHYRISSMPTYPGNFLQDHFSFTLMYFIPVYWLFNWLTGTYTLIIIQYTLIIIAAWYTLKFIQTKTDNIWLTTGVMIYYFTLLGRYTTFSCDVNIAVLSSCFIPVFIYLFEQKKYAPALIILMLSLFSRENIPIWFIFIFVTLIIHCRKNKKAVIFSIIGILISFAYFVILFNIFIPSIETQEKQFTLFNYSALGDNPAEALTFFVQHPVKAVKLFFVNHLDDPSYNGIKSEFYLVYLISGGFILFLRPQYIIWFIPIVAQKVLNDSYIRWGISTYYSIEIITLLPLSVFLTLSAIKSKYIQNILTFLICIATLTTTIYKLEPENVSIPWTLNPSKEKIYSKYFHEAPFNIKQVNKLLKKIPSNARVSASDHIFPHLSRRSHIYLFPEVNDAEIIVFSVFDNNTNISHKENEDERIKYFNDPDWQIIAEEYPVFLFKKNEEVTNESNNIFNNFKSDTLFCNYEILDTLKNKVLFPNNKIAEKISLITNEKAYSNKHSIILTPENPFSSITRLDKLNNAARIEITAWCHSEEDKANIIGSFGEGYHFNSNEADMIGDSGWKRLVLRLWVPRNPKNSICNISLWNSGTKPLYFDDLQIIIKYKK